MKTMTITLVMLLCVLFVVGCRCSTEIPVGEVVDIPNLREFEINYHWGGYHIYIRTLNFETHKYGRDLPKTTMEAITHITTLENCLRDKQKI